MREPKWSGPRPNGITPAPAPTKRRAGRWKGWTLGSNHFTRATFIGVLTSRIIWISIDGKRGGGTTRLVQSGKRTTMRSSSSTPIAPSTTRTNQLAAGMSTRNSGRLHSNRDRIIPDRFTSNSDYPEQAEPLLAKAFELGVLYVPATLVPACFSRFTTYLGSCNPMLTKFSAKEYSVWK